MFSMFKNKSLTHFVVLQILVLLCSIISSFFYATSLQNGLVFFLLQFFAVFIPGLAVCIFFETLYETIERTIAFSYCFGLILLIVEYYLTALTGVWFLSKIIGLLVAIFSGYIIFRNYHKIDDIACDSFSYNAIVLTAFIIIIDLYTVSLANPIPVDYSSVRYNKDFFYWVGNNISFLKGLPVNDFRLAGYGFYYHYFSNIIVAQQNLISGISVVILSFCYSYIIVAMLLVYSSFCFLRQLINNKYLVLLGVFLILFTEGTTIYMASHLYFCPFGFDYAYAIGMLAICILLDMYHNDDYSLKSVILSCLLIMFTTGLKGPVALVILMGFGCVTLSLLIRKQFKKGLILGFAWLLSFVLIYCIFVYDISGKTISTNELMFLGPIAAFDNNLWAIDILNELLNKGYADNGISRLLALVMFIIRSNRGAMILLILSVFYIFFEILNKRADVKLLVIVSVAIWGILLTINTHQDGNSQLYFIMSCIPYAAMSGLYVADRLSLKWGYLLWLAVVVVLLFSFSDLKRFAIERVKDGIDNAVFVYKGYDQFNDKGYRMTSEEYQMAMWLKDNCEPLDYIAQDCFAYEQVSKEELLGVFSERFIWNDGKYAYEIETDRRRAIVDRVYMNDLNAIDDLKKENVRYLIQTLSQHPHILNFDIVYRSDNYVIYKLY